MVPEVLSCVFVCAGGGRVGGRLQPQQEGDSRTSEAEHMWPSAPSWTPVCRDPREPWGDFSELA